MKAEEIDIKVIFFYFIPTLPGTERKKKKLSTVNPFKIQGGEGTGVMFNQLNEIWFTEVNVKI